MSEATQLDDETLVAAYRSGDDAALGVLVERHQPQVYRLALGVLASPQEAEDAAQESMVAMFSSLPRFRGDARFSTWLYRLTLNTCLKLRRRPSRRWEAPLLGDEAAPAGALPAAGPSHTPEARADRAWLRDRVAAFLARLPDAYRIPVVLSDALNVDAREIAQTLDISLPAAKARILRGRRRLRDEVERYCQLAGLSGWRELL